MKLVTVKICQDQIKQTTTPEQKEHQRKIYEPRDLDEALLSVRHDELITRMQEAIEAELDKRFAEMFFGPTPA